MIIAALFVSFCANACSPGDMSAARATVPSKAQSDTSLAVDESFGARLARAAKQRTHHDVVYDPSYVMLDYPGGDVAPDRGVCSDVIVRSLRALDIDLQVLVHEDMTRHFGAYPSNWGLTRPDPNIDHRRVPNIETFLIRQGARLPPSQSAVDYHPGDIVAWNLRGEDGFLAHIGIVSDEIGPSGAPMVVHNMGAGPKLDDFLFSWPMTGRYRIADQDTLKASAQLID